MRQRLASAEDGIGSEMEKNAADDDGVDFNAEADALMESVVDTTAALSTSPFTEEVLSQASTLMNKIYVVLWFGFTYNGIITQQLPSEGPMEECSSAGGTEEEILEEPIIDGVVVPSRKRRRAAHQQPDTTKRTRNNVTKLM